MKIVGTHGLYTVIAIVLIRYITKLIKKELGKTFVDLVTDIRIQHAKYLIDNNFIDCVIQLPENLFFGTSIATCILVMSKNKTENKDLAETGCHAEQGIEQREESGSKSVSEYRFENKTEGNENQAGCNENRMANGMRQPAEGGRNSALFPPSAYLRSLAAALTAGVTEPLIKAKCFYDFITKKVRYSFMPSYFCLDRMAERCAMDRVGDCGIQALLFLSLCEAVGIPARWESGLKTEPGFIGAHDWVRFYSADFGWRAADLSYGGSAWKRGDEILHRFYFGNVDPWRMAANARILGETGFPEPEFRADPYDNQVGEMALDGSGLRYEEFCRRKEVLRAEEIPHVIRS